MSAPEIPAGMLQRILEIDRSLALEERIATLRGIAAGYGMEVSIGHPEDRVPIIGGEAARAPGPWPIVVGLDPKAVPRALIAGMARKAAAAEEDFRGRFPRDLAERRETRGLNRGSIRERNRAEMRRSGLTGRGRR